MGVLKQELGHQEILLLAECLTHSTTKWFKPVRPNGFSYGNFSSDGLPGFVSKVTNVAFLHSFYCTWETLSRT